MTEERRGERWDLVISGSMFVVKFQLFFTHCHILGLLYTLNFCKSNTKIIQIIHQDDTNNPLQTYGYALLR